MKSVYLFLFLIFFSNPAISQFKPEDENFKSKIKLNKISAVNIYKNDKLEQGTGYEEIEFIYFYDTLGNITEKQSFYNMQMIERDVYFYDVMGNMIEEFWYNPDNINTFYNYTLYEMNKSGNVVFKNIYNADSSLRMSLSYIYNEKNLKSEVNVKQYFEEGEEYNEYYIYNDKNKIENHKAVSTENEIILDENYIYDEQGRLIEINLVNEDAEKNIIYEYDANNNIISYTEKSKDDEGNSLKYYEFVYDEKGMITQETQFDANKKPLEILRLECIK